MNEPSISYLRLTDVGALELKIPVLAYGSGRPILTLITGVHGNETAGLFVVDRLLRDLPELKGQLRIIPSANPIAQALQLRTSPRDSLDLNRIFPGRSDGQLPDRIAHALVKTVSDSDLVIDFHSFDLRNPVMAILANNGAKDVISKTIDFIRAFEPEIVWQLDALDGTDPEYRSALSPTLHELGVPNFAVELPTNYRLTDDDITTAVEGVRNVMGKLGMVATKPRLLHKRIPVYRRQDFFSPLSGLLLPEVGIMTEVTAGQTIARLRSIATFADTKVKAPFDGLLLQIHDRAMVITGQSIFAMGHPVEE